MDSLNSTHPQDGNQIVIAKNSGTIHIHNNSKTNEDINRICDRLDRIFIDFRENFEITQKEKVEYKRRPKR